MPESNDCGPETTWTLCGPLLQVQVTASPGATVTAEGPKDLPTIETVAAAEAVAGAAAARAVIRRGRTRGRRGIAWKLGLLRWQPPWAIRLRTHRAVARCRSRASARPERFILAGSRMSLVLVA